MLVGLIWKMQVALLMVVPVKTQIWDPFLIFPLHTQTHTQAPTHPPTHTHINCHFCRPLIHNSCIVNTKIPFINFFLYLQCLHDK